MKTAILLIASLICLNLTAQQPETIRVMCYNVENLFDIKDDSLTNDVEYLPGGMRG